MCVSENRGGINSRQMGVEGNILVDNVGIPATMWLVDKSGSSLWSPACTRQHFSSLRHARIPYLHVPDSSRVAIRCQSLLHKIL